MKRSILRAALLGVVASASFSFTQAASLAATSARSAPAVVANKCQPVNRSATAAASAPAAVLDPAQEKLFIGGL